jgi:hypothetical protein
MGIGTIISIGWTLVSRGFSGGGFRDTAERIASRLVDLKDAESEVEKAEIERDIVQLQAVANLQKPSSSNFRSPMMIGQYLIVIPFGIWWASVFLVSVVRPFFLEGRWTVDDVPPHIFEMAWWLIPTIVAGTILERRK